MKKYTDSDVQRLVKSAQEMASYFTGGPYQSVPAMHDEAIEALKPFLPDPEEELVEAMVRARFSALYESELPPDPIHSEAMKGMRAALAVVKEKGLPK